MPLIICYIDPILTLSANCDITNSTGAWTFEITDTKLYVLVANRSTQDNARLLQQLNAWFKRKIH